jgi:hypothetical protein
MYERMPRSIKAAMGCALYAVLAITGCSDSATQNLDASAGNDAGGGSGGKAGGAAAHDGGSGGASTSGDTTSDSELCMQRAKAASDAVQRAVDQADLSCESDTDCEITSNSTRCHPACGALVSSQGRYAVQDAVDTTNQVLCGAFETAGCKAFLPPCEPPGDFGCTAGRCEWRERGGAPDSGTRVDDAAVAADASSEAGCVARPIKWGPNGGFVAYSDTHMLMPCRDYAFERVGSRDPDATTSCENVVTPAALVSIDDVNAALDNTDVAAAIAAPPPVLYGADSRPVDGVVFRIEIGKGVIDLGGECNGSAGCKAIPAGLKALQDTLLALTEQQMQLPNCDEVP